MRTSRHPMSFAQWLTYQRKARRWTRATLATKVNSALRDLGSALRVTGSAINGYETRGTYPRPERLAAIALVFDFNIDRIPPAHAQLVLKTPRKRIMRPRPRRTIAEIAAAKRRRLRRKKR